MYLVACCPRADITTNTDGHDDTTTLKCKKRSFVLYCTRCTEGQKGPVLSDLMINRCSIRIWDRKASAIFFS